MFDNTIAFVQSNPIATIVIFLVNVCIAMYATFVAGPVAPGYGILIGFMGAFCGIGMGFFVPQSATVMGVNQTLADYINKL